MREGDRQRRCPRRDGGGSQLLCLLHVGVEVVA
jgi:hypothetical protein